jgi:hypothetical protein
MLENLGTADAAAIFADEALTPKEEWVEFEWTASTRANFVPYRERVLVQWKNQIPLEVWKEACAQPPLAS